MELNKAGRILEYKNGKYRLTIDGKFIIEDEDLDYILTFFKKDDIITEKVVELW